LEREDFLDPLSQDPVKKSWSLQADESKTEITLRNLVWAGYVGYHRTNSNIFGGVYMGNGIRSQDLPFII
jgi:radial spoke head protein 9